MSILELLFVVGGLLAGTLQLVRPRPIGNAKSVTEGRVSIVVPARNEATTLPVLLGSLARLDPAPYEVIVVDDASTDATAVVAASFGASVIQAPVLPDGWLGKPWACQIGADAATGSHLLFLDADTWLAPDGLARLFAEHGGGLLSIQPFHRTERPYEQASAFPGLVAAMGTGAFSPWPSRRRPVAFGPCILVSRTDYDRVGGHAAVRGDVVEDIKLARRFREAGFIVECRTGGDAVGFRMYPGGARQLVEGWTKNLAAGARLAAPLPVMAATWWVAACATVVVALIASGASWLIGGGDAPIAASVAWLAVSGQLFIALRFLGSFRWWTAAAFPVPLAAFVAIFLGSATRLLLRRPLTWRGRRFPASAV